MTMKVVSASSLMQDDAGVLLDRLGLLGSWMTTCLGKSCSFGLPRVPFVNCCQFMYLVISLLVLRAGFGIWLYQFLIIAYLFLLRYNHHKVQNRDRPRQVTNNTNGFQSEIKIKGQRLEEVENFKYLGAILSNEGSKPEIIFKDNPDNSSSF